MRRIALIQPLIATGKSLGIMKAPESIMALAGALEAAEYDVRMYHSAAGDALQNEIESFNPDFVGISTMTPNYPEGRRIAQRIKSWKPSVPIILGGWHASGCVQAYISGQELESLGELLNVDSPFDFVIAGEGEVVLLDLLDQLRSGAFIRAKNGLCFFRRGRINASVPQRIWDLSTLARPSWSGLDINSYRDKRSGDLDLSVHFNRSCRFQCGFCSTPVVYGHGVRTTPAMQAVDYLNHLVETYRPQVVTFTDEDFFAHLK